MVSLLSWRKKWEWVCVYDEVAWRSEGSFSPNSHITLLAPQRWRHRALARRRWCPARPRPHHLLGSTSRASCAMTSPLATTMGSALVKAARCVCGGVDALGNWSYLVRSETRAETLRVSGYPSEVGGACFAQRWLIDWVRPGQPARPDVPSTLLH